jgi:hypothetical protein
MLLAGCATSHSGIVLDPVGPAPITHVTPATTGNLVVYSAAEVNASFNRRDPDRQVYSDYRILNPDGTLRERVHNDSGTLLQAPQAVALPAGTYRVVAQSNGYGTVTVPVTIAAGQNTEVHLDGDSTTANPDPASVVRLPDGEVVGWKSSMAMK